MSRVRTAKVVPLSLDEPPRPLRLDGRHEHVLLVVSLQRSVIGEVTLPGRGVVSAREQLAAVNRRLGQHVSKRWLATAFARATRGDAQADDRPSPPVSVIVGTRDRPQRLRDCLEAITSLTSAPDEVIVVDSAPSDARAEEACADYAVRYFREEIPGLSRARNRGIAEAKGELIAFTDDDCVVDAHWLDRVGDPFADPLVMAVGGYVGPRELETPAQWLFHACAAGGHVPEPGVFGCWSRPRPRMPGENLIVRRRAFEDVGTFAEELGPGTPAGAAHDDDFVYRLIAAGYRIRYDPARVVWHHHPERLREARRRVVRRVAGASAYATRCMLRRRDLPAIGVALRPALWLLDDLRPGRGGGAAALSLDLAALGGALTGPLLLPLAAGRRGRGRAALQPPMAAGGSAATRTVVAAEPPPLSVAIATHNRQELLVRVLEGLARQAYPPERFETIVVLDGCTDDSAHAVRSVDVPYRIRAIEQESRGLGAARNRGAREACAGVVVFLDDDVIPEPDFLAAHAEAHAAAGDGHFILGYTPPVIRETGLWSTALSEWWDDFFRRRTEPNHQWTFADVADGNSSLPRSLFLNCGGFEEGLERRHDWEFAVRLLKRGVRLAHCHGACGWHHFDTSFEAALRNRRLEGRADIPFVTKHPEVTGRLPLSALAGMLDGRASRRRLAYRHPAASERLARGALPLLSVLEAARLRRHWHRLSSMLLFHSYLLGVADALPSLEQLGPLVAPSRLAATTETVKVDLGLPGAFEAPLGHSGALDLDLRAGETSIGVVPALEPARQWDWEALTERVVRGVSVDARRVAPRHPSEAAAADLEVGLSA